MRKNSTLNGANASAENGSTNCIRIFNADILGDDWLLYNSIKQCSILDRIKIHQALKTDVSVQSSSANNPDRIDSAVRENYSVGRRIDAVCAYENILKELLTRKSRNIVKSVDNYEKFALASAGFKLFVNFCSDRVLIALSQIAVHTGKCPVKDGAEFIAMILRYSWCHLKKSTRQCWERESEKLNGNSLLPNVTIDRIDSMYARKRWCQGTIFLGYMKCPLCREKENYMPETSVQDHLIDQHADVVLYACHYCFEVFRSVEHLKEHSCAGFVHYMLSLLLSKPQLTMDFVMHSIVCIECGLQLPLSLSTESKPISIARLHSLRHHDSSQLAACIVFFAERPSEFQFVTFKGNRKQMSSPMSYSICKHEYNCVEDIGHHSALQQKDALFRKCPLCQKAFVSKSFFKNHVLEHLSDSCSLEGLIDTMTSVPGIAKDSSTKISTDVVQQACNKETETVRLPALQAAKKTNDNVCRYCRQLNVISGNLTSDLCECNCSGQTIVANGSSNRPLHLVHLSADLHSLDSVFHRNVKLHIGRSSSVYDPMLGALPVLSLFMCSKCDTLILGYQYLMKHVAECYDERMNFDDVSAHDLETDQKILRLFNSEYSLNTRIGCPFCTSTCCSIRSLRIHLWTIHDIFANLKLPDYLKHLGLLNWNGHPSAYYDIPADINVDVGLNEFGDFPHADGYPVLKRDISFNFLYRCGYEDCEPSSYNNLVGPPLKRMRTHKSSSSSRGGGENIAESNSCSQKDAVHGDVLIDRASGRSSCDGIFFSNHPESEAVRNDASSPETIGDNVSQMPLLERMDSKECEEVPRRVTVRNQSSVDVHSQNVDSSSAEQTTHADDDGDGDIQFIGAFRRKKQGLQPIQLAEVNLLCDRCPATSTQRLHELHHEIDTDLTRQNVSWRSVAMSDTRRCTLAISREYGQEIINSHLVPENGGRQCISRTSGKLSQNVNSRSVAASDRRRSTSDTSKESAQQIVNSQLVPADDER